MIDPIFCITMFFLVALYLHLVNREQKQERVHTYMVPLEDLQAFHAFLLIAGLELKQLTPTQLEREWVKYCDIKAQAGE